MGYESLWDLSCSLNLQRKNEYHIMTKDWVLFLFGPPEGHEAPIFGQIRKVFIVPLSPAYNREGKMAWANI